MKKKLSQNYDNKISLDISKTSKSLFVLFSLGLITTSCSLVNVNNIKIQTKNNEIDLGYNSGNSVPINFRLVNNEKFNTKAIVNTQLGTLAGIHHYKIAMQRVSAPPPPSFVPPPPATSIFSSATTTANILNDLSNPKPFYIKNLKPDSFYYIAARAYSSTDDSVNIVALNGNPADAGGGTSRTINPDGGEYIYVNSSGNVSIINDATTEAGSANTDDNFQIDIEMQLMKTIGGQVTNNAINKSNGTNSLSVGTLASTPVINTKLSDISINTNTSINKSKVDISSCIGVGVTSGNYVVTWTADSQDGSGAGIYAQVFDKNNSVITPSPCNLPECNSSTGEFRINQQTAYNQTNSKVSMANDGTFVVTWENEPSGGGDYEIYARRFQTNGTPLTGISGNEFLVNTYGTNQQNNPQIAHHSDGSFVIVWESDHQVSANKDIYARKYTNTGTPLFATETIINTTTVNNQTKPSVDVNKSSGEILFAWEHDRGDGININARRFDSSFTPLTGVLGNEFRANALVNPTYGMPSIFYNNSTGMSPNHFAISSYKNAPSIETQFFSSLGINNGKRVDTDKEAPLSDTVLSIDTALDKNNNFITSAITDNGSTKELKVFQYDYDRKALSTSNTVIVSVPSAILDNQAKITYTNNNYLLSYIYNNQVKVKVLPLSSQ
ncbi:MAG: hypothetical protein U0354_11580 [Candidatus Sericytochromatia bacterium]